MENYSKICEIKYLTSHQKAVISHKKGYLSKLKKENKNMSFRGENDNLARRENPNQKYHVTSAGLSWAFTLAETLITLFVIGVVAVLTIPALMQQIGDYTLEKQRTVFEKKFEEGLRQMRVDEKLSEKYATTEDFVNAMQKYFKISTVCNKDSLADCFVDIFTAKAMFEKEETASKKFTTSNIKTSKNLVEKSAYNTDVMGIVFSDGVKMLITYDTECEGITSGDTTGDLYSCFGYVADVNGNKSPNSSDKDIISNLPLINNFGLSFEIVANKTRITWADANAYCASLGASLPEDKHFNEIGRKIYTAEGTNCRTSTSNNLRYEGCTSSIVTQQPLYKYLYKNSTIWSKTDNQHGWTPTATRANSTIISGGNASTTMQAICVK